MKSELIVSDDEKTPLYPYWGITNKDTDRVVVVEFTSPNTGIILHCGSALPYIIGQNCNDWAESNFIPLPKTAQVVLSQ